MRILVALFFSAISPAVAQKVEVPSKMDFAGMTLIIRDDARKEIQKDVDALTASPRHYQIKVQRARTYFPIIEEIFREENLPDDFKYLVLQESALIADAVSTSNAVGFWQFKDFTAIEMGLRVDRNIDERMNIASSTRAAARYLKKHYQQFNNWLYALQAYQMGAGGLMRAVKDTQPNAKRMEITGKTYWYVKKFLAHKIAYEGGVIGRAETRVVVFENRGRNSLSRLAKETKVDEDALRELNKWVRSDHIPDDRAYAVLLPVTTSVPVIEASHNLGVVEASAPPSAVVPAILGKVNGVRTIQAVEGDDLRRLVARAGVDFRKFLKWNDLKKNDRVTPGQVYFLGKKRLKGSEDFHKLARGESLWTVSQRYGLRLKRLKRYNRIDDHQTPPAGTMLYLVSRKPREVEHLASVDDAVEVDAGSTFTWSVEVDAEPVAADEVPQGSTVALTVVQPTSSEVEEQPKGVAENEADSGKILQTEETAEEDQDEIVESAPIDAPRPVERIHRIPENREHVVQVGETLYGISRRYGLSVMELVEWNALSLDAGIQPGQVIRLADSSGSATGMGKEVTHAGEGFYHEVGTSDTLYSIARKYNVTIKDIMDWNRKTDFVLSVGEKLKIMQKP